MCLTCDDLRDKRDNARTEADRRMYQAMLDGHIANTCPENRNAAGIRAAMERAREERKQTGWWRRD